MKNSAQQKIFILHGWAYELTKWQPFLSALAANFEVVLLPLPGLTAKLEKAWTMTDYLDWLADKTKDEQEIILLGHSFGGHLAIKFCANYPEKVSHLILIDSAGIRDLTIGKKIKRRLFFIAAKLGKLICNHPTARRLIYRLAGEKDYLQANPVMRETMQNILKDEVCADLPKIRAKTCIIWGQNDKTTPLAMGKKMYREIAGSRLEIIAGAKHGPHFSHSQNVAEIVRKFII